MLLLILLSISMQRSVQVRLALSFWRYRWARMEYGPNTDDPTASMTKLLIAMSVGRWFMGLSVGLRSSHARCALASSFLIVRKEVCQAGWPLLEV